MGTPPRAHNERRVLDGSSVNISIAVEKPIIVFPLLSVDWIALRLDRRLDRLVPLLYGVRRTSLFILLRMSSPSNVVEIVRFGARIGEAV
jgi:hypothetical protein